MKHVAAYLLAVQGGNPNPSAEDIKTILSSVGIKADDKKLEIVINSLKGKKLEELIEEGSNKLAFFRNVEDRKISFQDRPSNSKSVKQGLAKLGIYEPDDEIVRNVVLLLNTEDGVEICERYKAIFDAFPTKTEAICHFHSQIATEATVAKVDVGYIELVIKYADWLLTPFFLYVELKNKQ